MFYGILFALIVMYGIMLYSVIFPKPPPLSRASTHDASAFFNMDASGSKSAASIVGLELSGDAGSATTATDMMLSSTLASGTSATDVTVLVLQEKLASLEHHNRSLKAALSLARHDGTADPSLSVVAGERSSLQPNASKSRESRARSADTDLLNMSLHAITDATHVPLPDHRDSMAGGASRAASIVGGSGSGDDRSVSTTLVMSPDQVDAMMAHATAMGSMHADSKP
jgi:hypothetical protein